MEEVASSTTSSSMEVREEGTRIILDIDRNLANSVSEELHALQRMQMSADDFTICRVPPLIREGNEKYYDPSIVSIGPYHRGRKHLQPMEAYKLKFLNDFLERNTDITLEVYINSLREVEDRARSCYFDHIDLTSDEFVRILLLDGCFILELFQKKVFESEESNILEGTSWLTVCVTYDLLILENQIPFFVLDILMRLSLQDVLSDDDEKSMAIVQLFGSFFRLEMDTKVDDIDHLLHLATLSMSDRMSDINASNKNDTTNGRTFLRLASLLEPLWLALRRIYRTLSSKQKSSREEDGNEDEANTKSSSSLGNLLKPLKLALLRVYRNLSLKNKKKSSYEVTTIPSASKLVEYGLKIKKRSGDYSIMDIACKDGVLEIPLNLQIGEELKCLLFNVLAFEQCNISDPKKRKLWTYYLFMDFLIDTSKDVEILQECGIIVSYLKSTEDTALFFNQLNHHAYIDRRNNYLVPVYEEINKFCSSKWHRYKAKLKRDYFSNPWAILSLVAAVILLILTMVQTFFAVYGYFKPPS